jgi:hypothetical protein
MKPLITIRPIEPFSSSGRSYGAFAEGKMISSHFCSSDNWARRDLAADSSHKPKYDAYYPHGYEVVFSEKIWTEPVTLTDWYLKHHPRPPFTVITTVSPKPLNIGGVKISPKPNDVWFYDSDSNDWFQGQVFTLNEDSTQENSEVERLKQVIHKWAAKNLELTDKVVDQEIENSQLREIIERFCTKSNGLSVYARSEAYHQNKVPKELTEKIFNLYDYQCEIESRIRSQKP